MEKLLDKKKKRRIVCGVLAGSLLAAGIFFFTFFEVKTVEVMGSTYYEGDQIKELALQGSFMNNSVLASFLHKQETLETLPFVEGYSVTMTARDTICIRVQEKKPVGCIAYLGDYIYFDRNGIFVEGSKTKTDKIPYFDEIQVNKVVKNEKISGISKTVLHAAIALSTIFQKSDEIPDHIRYDENDRLTLVYADITVILGADELLEDKMTRVLAILPQLSGKKGTLHVENITETSKTCTFEEEVEEVTAENWTGGYDENGDYTGDGEYDENGEYVGERPKTDLEKALERWPGGYDEEGDYTGYGEYDADWNYVGSPPTEESIAANGDWKGGYEEDGTYDGVGEYDYDGNYVGERE